MAGKLSFHFPLLACCPVQLSSSTQIVNWAFPPALSPQQPYLSFLPISFPAGIVPSHQFRACSLALKVHRVALANSPVQSATDGLVEGKSKDLSVSGDSICRRFLDFYATRGHKVLPSASLVPDDPTVLLTIAGMLQFKPIFLGQVPRQVPRATTAQRCIHTNDVETVGRTTQHHTFFKMLGNFSFGDYFKEEAVQWAWELSTVEFGLPANRLWISVFEEDNEAFEI